MKVTGVKTYVVENEPGERSGGGDPTIKWYVGGKFFLILELMTDEGIIGIGEKVTGSSFTGDMTWRTFESQIKLVHETVEAFVVGQDPFNIEKIWYDMYAGRHDYRLPSMHYGMILSGIEMALWDIVGKATNQPIYNLLGGKYWEKLRAYAYMPPIPEGKAENAGKIAENLLKNGNSACKFDPFHPIQGPARDIGLSEITYCENIFKSIRSAVGNELEVGLGTHGQLTTYSAIRVAKAIEPYQPFWFEEPVPPENIDEMARVAAHTSIPIATGERLATIFQFSEIIRKQAAQIIQIDIGQCGGIMVGKKVAGIAEASYAVIAPHMYCGPIAAAAALQVAACSPNFMITEANQGPLHKKIFKEPIVFKDGFIQIPEGPGLGVELDENVIKSHLVS
ncbi:MAG: hypothetical protein CL736_05890 [Chloroflexi bacterium]|nr:hypothetical protein [Chloroflexota bacterium]